jgi:hypothetical protein
MARGIVVRKRPEAFAEEGTSEKSDTYLDRVAKYVPVETLVLWAAAGGVISTAPDESQSILLWITLAVGTILTAVYIWIRTKEQGQSVQITQTIISTIAFAVWVFAVGGPFADFSWYHPTFGSFALIIYSAAVGVVEPKPK